MSHPRPQIVCLCGSTRFIDSFRSANFRETMAGKIVLSIGCDTKNESFGLISDSQKESLEELHKRKIDLADEVLILNVGGYVGKSTLSEIIYADRLKKILRWLEPMRCPCCKGSGGFDMDEDSVFCALCKGSGNVGAADPYLGQAPRFCLRCKVFVKGPMQDCEPCPGAVPRRSRLHQFSATS